MSDIFERLTRRTTFRHPNDDERLLDDALAEMTRLRSQESAIHGLVGAIEFCHARGETFPARVSVAYAELLRTLSVSSTKALKDGLGAVAEPARRSA